MVVLPVGHLPQLILVLLNHVQALIFTRTMVDDDVPFGRNRFSLTHIYIYCPEYQWGKRRIIDFIFSSAFTRLSILRLASRRSSVFFSLSSLYVLFKMAYFNTVSLLTRSNSFFKSSYFAFLWEYLSSQSLTFALVCPNYSVRALTLYSLSINFICSFISSLSVSSYFLGLSG